VRSIVDGSEESEVHSITMSCRGSMAAPGSGEVKVKAATPERARVARGNIEWRIREGGSVIEETNSDTEEKAHKWNK
jgi:hypothetical protein